MRVVCWLMSLGFVLLTGCATQPDLKLAHVGGVVTVAAKPVSGGQIIFMPKVPGPAAFGAIGMDGRYTVTTLDQVGAVIGEHDVMIESMPVALPPPPAGASGKAAARPEIARRYGLPYKSGLTATVTSGSNAIDFALEP
jgi:hypothetical protein